MSEHKIQRCSVHMNKKLTTSNLEVLDNLNCVRALEGEQGRELQC